MVFVKDRSSIEAAEGKKSERISLKEAIHVITANDQLKVYIGVVLAYNMLVQLAGGMALCGLLLLLIGGLPGRLRNR